MNAGIVLQDAFKTSTHDQDKIISPEETVARFQDKLKGVDIDILAEVVRIDNGRLGIPVYFSRCGQDAKALTGTTKQMGKGATPRQAKASAVMELAERFSFFSFCNDQRNFQVAPFEQMEGQGALSFDKIARSVHDQSDDLPLARNIFKTIPMRWTKGFNLSRQKEVMVPFDWFYTINEFNGPSAGNCQEEALLQGICEVIERHVCAKVSHGQISTSIILPDNARNFEVKGMLEKYRTIGSEFVFNDFSLDTGIPTVSMIAYDPSTFPVLSEIVWTAGTTPDPEKALSRAMTEVAQLAGDFTSGSNYVASGLPKLNHVKEADFLFKSDKTVTLTDLPDLANDNFKVEIENCLTALQKINLEVICINTRHNQLDIPAFYTIIPGAHFRERALGASVGMFSAKLIMEKYPAPAALKKLHTADQQLPGKYYLQFYLGNAYLNLGDPETATAHLQQALELNPPPQEMVDIYSYLGVCHKDMGRYTEAVTVLNKGLAIDTDRTDIHNLMGFCHFKLRAYETAIGCFEKGLQLNPGSAIDYANIGVNYKALGERAKAIEYYTTALQIDPSIEFARSHLEELGAPFPN